MDGRMASVLSIWFFLSYKINILAVEAVWNEMAISLLQKRYYTQFFPSIGRINVSNWDATMLIRVNTDPITSCSRYQKPVSVTLPACDSFIVTFVQSMFTSNIVL